MKKIVEIWLVVTNIPKSSRKWIGYILVDFY
jgi:hypothetical protein